jgi:hypothetical protein
MKSPLKFVFHRTTEKLTFQAELAPVIKFPDKIGLSKTVENTVDRFCGQNASYEIADAMYLT